MARPQKEGLDYFPLDVNMDQDDKIALIQAKHGLIGFSIIIKLLMKIYDNSYFYQWTEKEQLLFSNRVNVDINTLKEVVCDCIKWGLFNENVYNNYSILTSKGIQKRYFEAVNRRKKVTMLHEYCLVDVNEYKNIQVNRINVYINGDNANKNTTKKSKVKKSKVVVTEEEKSEQRQRVIMESQKMFSSTINMNKVMSLCFYIDKDMDADIILEALHKGVLSTNSQIEAFKYASKTLLNWYNEGKRNLSDLTEIKKEDKPEIKYLEDYSEGGQGA